ncbi:hypothetical protein M0811_02049 [Anaeramoeba ignava]|uniref:Uncharacterized protein n=1 Tax=Anaeramoeba ignava TaxID=1746090 RepID=A0A9Q0R892_ANAIG|nr:hypothetical protein M0811_02049 [Anaeramoeba ignava]
MFETCFRQVKLCMQTYLVWKRSAPWINQRLCLQIFTNNKYIVMDSNNNKFKDTTILIFKIFCDIMVDGWEREVHIGMRTKFR